MVAAGSIALALGCAWPVPGPGLPAPGGPPPGAKTPVAVIPDMVPPVVPERVWQERLQRLKVQTALSWTFAAIGLVGLTVPIAMLARCEGDAQFEACPYWRGAVIAAPIFGALAVASLVPAVIFTDRLVYHRRPERRPRLGWGPGGVVLRY